MKAQKNHQKPSKQNTHTTRKTSLIRPTPAAGLVHVAYTFTSPPEKQIHTENFSSDPAYNPHPLPLPSLTIKSAYIEFDTEIA